MYINSVPNTEDTAETTNLKLIGSLCTLNMLSHKCSTN